MNCNFLKYNPDVLIGSIIQDIIWFGSNFGNELEKVCKNFFVNNLNVDNIYKLGAINSSRLYCDKLFFSETRNIVVEAHLDKVVDYFNSDIENLSLSTFIDSKNNIKGCLDNSIGAGIVFTLNRLNFCNDKIQYMLTPYEEVGALGIRKAVENKIFNNKKAVIVLDISDDVSLEKGNFDICFYRYKRTSEDLIEIANKCGMVERFERFNNASMLNCLLPELNIISIHFQIKNMHMPGEEQSDMDSLKRGITIFLKFLSEVTYLYAENRL